MATPHMLTSEYRLLRRVGRGGMGEVWEAARIISDDIVVPCAIKLLHAEFTETARERKLFLDEARIATQLDNSRIVKVTGIGTGRDGRPFLVMERVDGIDLRGYLEAVKERGRGPLELNVVTYIVGEVLVALAYAHERIVDGDDGGIIHSDVTPGNILISSTGEVKLTDFGIARFAATAGPMSHAVGTARYMSPEQLFGEPQRATDVYGLGVVLHELLEGKRFLDELTPEQVRSRVLSGPAPELTVAGVPGWLDDLRRRMIATDPRVRPQARDALAAVVEHSPRYMTGSAKLTEDYATLIGPRRSGVTLMKVPIAAESEPAVPAVVQDGVSDEIEPTQLLPPASEAVTTSGPEVRKAIDVRWAVGGSLVLAVAFGVTTAVLLVDALREPSEVVAQENAIQTPTVREEPQVHDDLVPALVHESAPQIEPMPVVAPEPEPVAEAPEPEVEPTPASKPKKPANLPKIGVVFLLETNQEGQLKVGRKLVPVKNRSAYVELAPGNYAISWQPKGQDGWQANGRVKIDDISPDRYKVRLDGGKVVEVGKL